MAPEAPIGDWLHQGTSDPRQVAGRYDAWANGLDVDCGTGLVGRAFRVQGSRTSNECGESSREGPTRED